MESNTNELATAQPTRYWYLLILALSGFVTSFGAHIVATNLPVMPKRSESERLSSGC